VNQTVIGWINYYRIGDMKSFMKEFGEWLRHKMRVIILKQWKKPSTIYRNLQTINRITKNKFTDKELLGIANARQGWYRMSRHQTINFLISPEVLAKKKTDRPGLVNPLSYYLRKL
jgi:hypothetical protein